MAKKKSGQQTEPRPGTDEVQELSELNAGVAMLIDGQHLTGIESQLEEIQETLAMILSVLEKQSGPNASVRRRRTT